MVASFIKKYNKYENNNTLRHKFSRIMFLSCVRIDNNKYELTYLIDYLYKHEGNITLIPIKKIISYEEYIKVINTKFGVWLRNNSILDFSYLYIYHNLNTNKLLYKTTSNNNYLNKDSINQYSHKLIFKAQLKDKNVLYEYI